MHYTPLKPQKNIPKIAIIDKFHSKNVADDEIEKCIFHQTNIFSSFEW